MNSNSSTANTTHNTNIPIIPNKLSFIACIPYINIKCFQNIINFLLKIDTEIIIEVTKTGMWLRSLNDAKSAFVCIELNPNEFFSVFDVSVESNSNTTNNTNNSNCNNNSNNIDNNSDSDNYSDNDNNTNQNPHKRRKENNDTSDSATNVMYSCKIYGKVCICVYYVYMYIG